MRVTVIPAQVTTVEDRIVGSLNLGQLLLLCIPVFGGGLLYAALPPVMTISIYKISLLVMLGSLCGILAIRIKGAIVLFWATILIRYWLRPRYYVFDKHSLHGREQYSAFPEAREEQTTEAPIRTRPTAPLSFPDLVKVQACIEDPAANVAFETRKGGLYVRITEVKQES